VDRTAITAEVVSRLVAEQFREWAHLTVAPVELDGWDNTTFRLGDELSVRLPSADWYVAQVEKEQRWLPVLAPQLPLPVPEPVAQGAPGEGFPRPWSVYRWLPGEPATEERVEGLTRFATDLAGFLAALYAIDPAGGPPAGPHSFFRGGPLATYDAETRETISALDGEIDAGAATRVWEAALAATWDGRAVWVHGDVAASNLLVVDGRLSAVIDFGCSAVGDPACDLTIAWTFFSGESREAFRGRLGLDEGTWARGRGWALWKALITLAKGPEEAAAAATRFGWRIGAGEVVEEVLADHARAR
jgi:aminoglycoside phosphotransferase (APT) family kinase protein